MTIFYFQLANVGKWPYPGQINFCVEAISFHQQFNALEGLRQLRKPITVDVRFLIPSALTSTTFYYGVFVLTPCEKFSTVNVAAFLV